MFMNEHLFLKQLRMQLRGLSEEEIDDIIEDYKSYFSEARESGLSDEEVTQNLGHPFDIAQDIKASSKQKPTYEKSNESFSAQSIIIMIALILFNLTFVLGPAIGVLGVFFAIIFSCVMFVISPLLVIATMLFGGGHLFELFLSLVLCGIGILVFPLLLSLMKKGKKYINQYIAWNVRLVKGEVS